MSSMHEKKFEQQSQQQMENFRLQPGGIVWENIERELKKKKRRRVLFFIILPLLISMGGYGVYQLNNKHNGPVAKQEAASSEKGAGISNTENKNNTIITDKEENNKQEKNIVTEPATIISPDLPVDDATSSTITKKAAVIEKPVDNSKDNGSSKHEAVAKKSSAANGVKQKTIVDKIKKQKPGLSAEPAFVTKRSDNKKKQPQSIIPAQDSKHITDNTASKNETTKNTSDKKIVNDKQGDALALQGNTTDQLKKIDTAQVNDTVKSIAITAPAIDSVLSKMAAGKKIDKRIKWGVNFSGGISGSRTNIFAISSTEKSENLYDNFPTPGNSTGNGGVTPVIVTLPSAIKTGAAFNIGLVAEKRLSKRSSVSSGIQYAYMSESMTVGMRKDSVFQLGYANYYSQAQVGMAYRGISKVPYTNKYHFIKIPLLYHLQLNKSERVPLRWDVGISAAYLFANNGLVYDTVWNGLYYKQKNAFSKLHLSLQTGISVGFGKPTGMQWQIGPELSMDMTKLIAQPYDAKRYLFYSGIKAQLFFKKKK